MDKNETSRFLDFRFGFLDFFRVSGSKKIWCKGLFMWGKYNRTCNLMSFLFLQTVAKLTFLFRKYKLNKISNQSVMCVWACLVKWLLFYCLSRFIDSDKISLDLSFFYRLDLFPLIFLPVNYLIFKVTILYS